MNQNNIVTSDALPDYNLKIPAHIQFLLAAGLASGTVGLILIFLIPVSQPLFASILLIAGVLAAALSALLFLVMNNRSRLSARHKMMEAIAWNGDEMVLDVGCGNGFLILEAAKHLSTGKAVGIDVWQSDAGGQNTNAIRHNAYLEGVTDRIEVKNVDARSMPFEDETFDVIMSSLALHHMGSNTNRQEAVQEMIRVLKPGGTILLYDMFPMISQAKAVMRRNHLQQINDLGGVAMKVLSANKPFRAGD
jgi:arsenite methyltransferase